MCIVVLFFKFEVWVKLLEADYIGFEIFNKFVVGYGFDYNEFGCNLFVIY